MTVAWYETRLGLDSPQPPPVLGTFISLANQTEFSSGGFRWESYFRSGAAAYAVQKDEFDNFRFEIHPGDMADADVANNPGTERAEINHVGSLDQSKTINISYLQMIAPGDAIDSNKLFAFGQLHDVEDPGDAGGVVPLLMRCGDYSQVIGRAYSSKPTISSPPIVAASFGASPARGVWTSYRWRFKYDSVNGMLQIFRNEVLLIDYVGPFGYLDTKGPSPQFGIYRGTTTSGMTVVYYSGISISYE